MKRLIILISLLLLVFCGINSYGQENRDPTCYLNSRPINLSKVFINPMRIDSIRVYKSARKIMITTKDGEFSFYRLPDILKKYEITETIEPNDSIVYKINGQILKDTTSVEIDDSYFMSVVSGKLFNVKCASGQSKNVVIVNINLEGNKKNSEDADINALKDFLKDAKKK